MPLYIRHNVSWTPASLKEESFTLDDDDFIQDPDLHRDVLPQPYRMINKLLWSIIDDVWEHVNKRESERIAEASRLRPPRYQCRYLTEADSPLNKAECMSVTTDGCYIVLGLSAGLAVLLADTGRVVDHWADDNLHVTSIQTAHLADGKHLIATIDDMGVARLYALAADHLYLLITINDSNSETKIITSSCKLSLSAEYLTAFVEKPSIQTGWLEVHKLPKDAWIKDLDVLISKAGQKETPQDDSTTAEGVETTERSNEGTDDQQSQWSGCRKSSVRKESRLEMSTPQSNENITLLPSPTFNTCNKPDYYNRSVRDNSLYQGRISAVAEYSLRQNRESVISEKIAHHSMGSIITNENSEPAIINKFAYESRRSDLSEYSVCQTRGSDIAGNMAYANLSPGFSDKSLPSSHSATPYGTMSPAGSASSDQSLVDARFVSVIKNREQWSPTQKPVNVAESLGGRSLIPSTVNNKVVKVKGNEVNVASATKPKAVALPRKPVRTRKDSAKAGQKVASGRGQTPRSSPLRSIRFDSNEMRSRSRSSSNRGLLKYNPGTQHGERTTHRFAATTVHCKVSPPPELTGVSGSIQQCIKAVDSNCDVIGLGTHHMITASHLEQRHLAFKLEHEDLIKYLPEDTKKPVNQPNYHYMQPGRLVPHGLSSTPSGQPGVLAVWWQHGTQVLLYSLNKQAKELERKPDMVIPVSSYIVSSDVSSDGTKLVLALDNNNLIIWDVYLGIPRGVRHINDDGHVMEVSVLDPSICPQDNMEYPPYPVSTNFYVMVTMDTGQLYLVKCGQISEQPKQVDLCVMKENEIPTVCKTVDGLPNLLLTCRRNSQIFLHDLQHGVQLCEVTLPADYEPVSPWQPVMCVGSKGRTIYIKGQKKDASETSPGDEETGNSHTATPDTSLFVLELYSSLTLDKYMVSAENAVPFVVHSTVKTRVNALLKERFKLQETRVSRMQSRWTALKDEIQTILKMQEEEEKSNALSKPPMKELLMMMGGF